MHGRPEVVPLSRRDRQAVTRTKDPQKSRITNGALLPGIDGRSAWVRRCKDVIAAHMSDLGGEEATSAAERSIVRRASVLTVELERMEAVFATAGEASSEALDCYARIAANLQRLLQTIGLERRQKDVTSLGDLLHADAIRQQSEDRERTAQQRAAFEAKQRGEAP